MCLRRCLLLVLPVSYLLWAVLAAQAAGRPALPGEKGVAATPLAVPEKQALAILKAWISGQSPYFLPANCWELKTQGMKDGGHVFEAHSRSCPGRSTPALLDRWRVDGATGQIAVQGADGKYRQPPSKTMPEAGASQTAAPPFPEVEQLLIYNGFGYSLSAAEDLYAAHGAALFQALEMLLSNANFYQSNPMRTGAFPFNVLWLLSHIGGAQPRALLERYHKVSGNVLAELALRGLELREKQADKDYALLYAKASLLKSASQEAPVLAELEPGQAFRVLLIRVHNPRETAPRGGPATFDYVELSPSGEKGYIERSGSGDTPYF